MVAQAIGKPMLYVFTIKAANSITTLVSFITNAFEEFGIFNQEEIG